MKEKTIRLLYEKDTKDIYQEICKIENNIDKSDYLYECFDDIKNMLTNDKSFIRVRGFRIICKLSKYDKENKINKIINLLLNELDDDKPIAVRRCLSSICTLIYNKPELIDTIKSKIDSINYLKYKDTMSPLIKKDIDRILINISRGES